MGQPHLVQAGAAELAGGLVDDPPQHARERVGDRHDLVAEQQRALVDPAFGVRLEARRVQPGAAFGVPPDHQVPVLRGEHRGRHHRRPVDVDHPRRAAVRGQHGDRVGRAEIHRQDVHDSPLVRPRPTRPPRTVPTLQPRCCHDRPTRWDGSHTSGCPSRVYYAV
jgi:hypothetical protein